MNATLKLALAVAGLAAATHAAADITFYEHEGFAGRSFTTNNALENFQRHGFNDRASSVIVMSERWEVCEDARFGGRCAVLRPGRYASLADMGLNDRASSVRIVTRNARVDDNRYAPQPVPVYDNRRRKGERVYEANVTSVRAVLGQPEQRCWVEHEPGSQGSSVNVPGAVVGAILGGVLGHQVGSGRGNDAATVGGAVIGGAVGANVNRSSVPGRYGRDVQRCETVPAQGTPAYFDVTYDFRGQQHYAQTVSHPGRTISVNQRGEPRA